MKKISRQVKWKRKHREQYNAIERNRRKSYQWEFLNKLNNETIR